ncbi:MAG TPA: HEAT repeat domain-containing protein, partial [Verrucomicrobiae bacterium]|nr:HEAT repeat domain-containing protein [Verrucomicrobiae bacterium]
QWIFHPHHPELQVGDSWDEPRKLARLSIAQTQELTNGVALFEFPLNVRFKGPFGTVDKTLQVKEKQEDFFFPLSNAPDIARLDPDYVLLARIRFDPPRKMLAAQLKDETDLMGRIFALGSLDKSHDKETIDLIADRLRNDPFYGVRVEAAQALRTIHTKEAMEALLASTKQSDARVRQKITTELANFFDPSAERFEKQVISEEKNPDVKSHAVRGLASYPAEGIRPLLEENLRSESFEDLLGDAAIAAMRAQNDPSFIPDIISVLEKRQLGPTSRGLAHGLDAVAYLARNEQKKDAAYNFIVKYINSSRSRVQEAAIKALGVLRDDRALPVLATFASGAKDLPETTAAARAIETIRENRPVITELQGLRNEVIELKKQNDELKKSFDELSKKFDATSPKMPESAKPKKQGGRKGKGDQ